jgi:Flp pilus assembly protein TadB
LYYKIVGGPARARGRGRATAVHSATHRGTRVTRAHAVRQRWRGGGAARLARSAAGNRDDVDDRRKQLEDRMAWLRDAMAQLDREQRRIPWLAAPLALAVPGGLRWGGLAVLFVVLCVVFLASVWVYVVWAHRHEYGFEMKQIRRELRELDAAARRDERARGVDGA